MSITPNTNKQVDGNSKIPMLSIPYVSEAFTRVVKKELKRNNIEARVIVKSTGNLRQKYHKPLAPTCNCNICKLGVNCRMRHIVYDAQCKFCNEHYIGVTTAPRFKEHEASIRLGNDKSALSTHLNANTDNKRAWPNPEPTVWGFDWKFVDMARFYKDSFIKEAVCIKSLQSAINRNSPCWVQYIKI